MKFRFTLENDTLGSQIIDEPDGWKGAKMRLQRDSEFDSLIETYDGAAEGSFVFYGDNGQFNGGINFLKQAEQNEGLDAEVRVVTEIAPNDDESFESIFTGQADISMKTEMHDNKMSVPIIRDDFWAKFMNRIDTPVDIQANFDLDGNAVDQVYPVLLNLTSQKIRKRYEAYQDPDSTVSYTIPDNQYGQIDFFKEDITEINEKYFLPRVENSERPAPLFIVEFEGDYLIDIEIRTATAVLFGSGTETALEVRLQINDDSAIVLTQTSESEGLESWINHHYYGTQALLKGDTLRIYFYNNNASGTDYTFIWFAGILRESHLKIDADTIYPDTTAYGWLIHDAFASVCARMGLGNNSFYSEFLGSTLTNARVYDDDGCGWLFAVVKGLQIRQYSLSEKPFFISFRQLWDGLNPILCLGLSYDNVGTQVIRIEKKVEYYDNSDTSVDFPYVREISASYDQSRIFKTIRTGFKRWQSENSSGIDDPQTKHVYATRLKKAGKEINLESDFIAASLAIETTRRTTREKSADYKFDNENFIIAVKYNESPEYFNPQLDEDFFSVGNLLNSDARYNIMLTPKRNLIRWANYLNGCLYQYQDSSYRFVSGEGNYNMSTENDCITDFQICLALLCEEISENASLVLSDISNIAGLTYFNQLGYLFIPIEHTMTVSMTWEQYKTIRAYPKLAIGISQTGTDFTKFFVKDIEYNMIEGKAILKAWPKIPFTIDVIQ